MQPFRFVHAADLHIDSPFRGLRDIDRRIGDRLRESTFEAFDNLVNLCIDEQVDFLVIAGDIYDGADRSVRAQLRFRDGMRQLSEAGIAVYIVHGNHDPLDGWLSSVTWPESVHVFGADPEWKTVRLNDEPLAAIQGVSFPTREVRENLVAKFATPAKEHESLFTIGLLHCNVGGNPDHDNYAPCTLDDLKLTALDYWALGHVHTRQTLRKHSPAVVYPGNIQGRHPNEAGPRGCLMVSVSEDGSAETRFHAVDVVRWEPVEVDISEISSLDGLESAIQQRLDDLAVKAEGRDVVCSLSLVGRGPMHVELVRKGRNRRSTYSNCALLHRNHRGSGLSASTTRLDQRSISIVVRLQMISWVLLCGVPGEVLDDREGSEGTGCSRWRGVYRTEETAFPLLPMSRSASGPQKRAGSLPNCWSRRTSNADANQPGSISKTSGTSTTVS